MGRKQWGSVFSCYLAWSKKTFGPFRYRTKANLIVDGDATAGVCGEDDHGYYIYLDAALNVNEAIDCLTHELAHKRRAEKHGWEDTHDKNHDKKWGAAFASVYRKTTRYFDQQRQKLD